ncbi:7TM-DISM domain-containing protein [Desulfatitalea alkaliphila]|uniref:7TM-DISM domain-containing protein n=1 Tax=Desulfatitalea alkaliphila TaxID=2929485 RepID=A0AA41UI69_9BACT|nr:7TM-DISM domain-containing protein [Desulfatitalea alkaliphila]MCJ8499739.1 7TM-DISM domain-containing protein [Desulfatitalea alkaliphila]
MAVYDPKAPRWGEQFPARDFLTLPGLWQGETQAGVLLSPYGYGVYRLRIRLDPDSDPDRMSLLVSAPLSACRIWVDGLLVDETGRPGEDAESEQPMAHMATPWFVPTGEVVEIVLQVSNHHNLQGGLNNSILLGTEAQIKHLIHTRWILGALICGCLLALAVYHLTLFILHRRERANLFFGLFCLMWTGAIAFSPSYAFLLPHFLALPWNWGVTFSLLPFGLTIPLMTLFYHELFPKRYGQWVNIGYLSLGTAFMAYILASPPNAYDTVPFLYFLITRTVFVYLIGAFILDVVNRQRGVLLLIPGYLALGAAELDDILFDLDLVGSTDLAPLGVFIFICCYSLFMSSRYSRDRERIARLSAELETASRHLSQMHAMQESLDPARQGAMPPPDRRLLAVRVMNLAVDCWMVCTQTGKAELAKQSGLWNVYVEKDGYCRTQTLDKYLSEDALPRHPRWLKIHATAEFVLVACDDANLPARSELVQCLSELKTLA